MHTALERAYDRFDAWWVKLVHERFPASAWRMLALPIMIPVTLIVAMLFGFVLMIRRVRRSAAAAMSKRG
ncbi:hypothetical protein [Paracoccus shanxieyensis]|uniref:Uncharacterized protein n=1 Tax=Paracoccus shanxieyensis TaxID=2675752 RepID=A0A6L6IXC3_9RHOB|nr:hypothetical protein [Paracoccus shanxieyensis]MTH63932.1 hypothetical protein [Paracoccus shanxieyensis]MTH87027.1 hypothetical protein [Paracoccus shanxieyensis]